MSTRIEIDVMLAHLEDELPEWADVYPEQQFLQMLAEALDYIAVSADPGRSGLLPDAHRLPTPDQRRSFLGTTIQPRASPKSAHAVHSCLSAYLKKPRSDEFGPSRSPRQMNPWTWPDLQFGSPLN